MPWLVLRLLPMKTTQRIISTRFLRHRFDELSPSFSQTRVDGECRLTTRLIANYAAQNYPTHLTTLPLESRPKEPGALQTQSHHFNILTNASPDGEDNTITPERALFSVKESPYRDKPRPRCRELLECGRSPTNPILIRPSWIQWSSPF